VKTSRLTVKGQITLPKELRERFRLRAGDRVAFEPQADGIRVRPVRKTILDWAGVLQAPQPGLSDQQIRNRVRKMRAQRLERILSHGR
jgi:AbrB family looped-hinge helix DNA binding protein